MFTVPTRKEMKAYAHALLRRTGGRLYEPWPDPDEARVALENAQRSPIGPHPEIAIDDQAMLRLWDEMLPTMQAAPFTTEQTPNCRYWYDNGWFMFADGQIYFGLIGRFRPQQIIEIGSGYSTVLALDANEYLNLDCKLTLIEPDPRRLYSLLREGDEERLDLRPCKVQDVSLDLFATLGRDDILFIDSSHILKTGSDVCYELFRILPTLRPGVLVHLHDIWASFEYPREWVIEEFRGWNEVHAVRAFLSYNSKFKILFFNDYFGARHPDKFRAPGIHAWRYTGSSLWLTVR